MRFLDIQRTVYPSGRADKSRSLRRRPRTGHSAIEFGVAAGMITVMALLCTNIGLLILGAGINDKACRDAARAAAQASNYTAALKQARAALKGHPTDGYFVSTPVMNDADLVYEDFSGNPPPDTSPFVSVTTTTVVKIPAPFIMYGARFGPGGTQTFRRTYTFPIVKTTLYL